MLNFIYRKIFDVFILYVLTYLDSFERRNLSVACTILNSVHFIKKMCTYCD